jgi:hypothetical protein
LREMPLECVAPVNSNSQNALVPRSRLLAQSQQLVSGAP